MRKPEGGLKSPCFNHISKIDTEMLQTGKKKAPCQVGVVLLLANDRPAFCIGSIATIIEKKRSAIYVGTVSGGNW